MGDDTLTDIYNRFATAHGCFLDGILCDPELREPFLEDIRARVGDAREADLLRRLVYLRKRGKLARRKPR
ncbi:MAG: hypothetical protein HQ582_12105 [Planctomycetes bacterium]|nr:hypothetical protein [Planctomycetota bacterium]